MPAQKIGEKLNQRRKRLVDQENKKEISGSEWNNICFFKWQSRSDGPYTV